MVVASHFLCLMLVILADGSRANEPMGLDGRIGYWLRRNVPSRAAISNALRLPSLMKNNQPPMIYQMADQRQHDLQQNRRPHYPPRRPMVMLQPQQQMAMRLRNNPNGYGQIRPSGSSQYPGRVPMAYQHQQRRPPVIYPTPQQTVPPYSNGDSTATAKPTTTTTLTPTVPSTSEATTQQTLWNLQLGSNEQDYLTYLYLPPVAQELETGDNQASSAEKYPVTVEQPADQLRQQRDELPPPPPPPSPSPSAPSLQEDTTETFDPYRYRSVQQHDQYQDKSILVVDEEDWVPIDSPWRNPALSESNGQE